MPGDRHTSSPSPAAPHQALSIRARLRMLAALAIVPLLIDRILLEAERTERFAAAAEDALDNARRNIASQQEGLATARAMLQWRREATSPWGRGRRAAMLCSQGQDGLGGAPRRPDRLLDRRACGRAQRVRPSLFRHARRTGEWALSDSLGGRRPRAPTLMAALPVPADGGFAGGVLIAGLDPQWIGRLDTAVAGRDNAVALMADGEDSLIASHPRVEAWVGRPIQDPALVTAMRSQSAGTTSAFDGEPRARLWLSAGSRDQRPDRHRSGPGRGTRRARAGTPDRLPAARAGGRPGAVWGLVWRRAVDREADPVARPLREPNRRSRS